MSVRDKFISSEKEMEKKYLKKINYKNWHQEM